MPRVKSEYEIESLYIDRLIDMGYDFIPMKNYDDVCANFRKQFCKLNSKELIAAKGVAELSDTEFDRVMIRLDNHTIYESAKILREKWVLELDDGKTIYVQFFTNDETRNIYQVTNQITMDPAHKDDVLYKNRYDVTIFINGLPLVQTELKRPGIEINEAVNQINRYRRFSFKGLFRYIQLFVISNSTMTKYCANINENNQHGKKQDILKSLTFFWTDENNVRINKLVDINGASAVIQQCEKKELEIKKQLGTYLQELEVESFDGLSTRLFDGSLRFRNSDGNAYPDWTDEFLGDLFESRSERGNETEELLSVTIANGVIKQSDGDKKDNSSEDKSKYKLVKVGDFAYNTMRMWQGAAGVSKYQGIVSPVYTVTIPSSSINAKFFEYLFKTKKMQNVVIAESTGIASDKWSLSYEKFADIEVCIPCLDEQNKIVSFFELIDELLVVQSLKLEALKDVKKGLLQQMFI